MLSKASIQPFLKTLEALEYGCLHMTLPNGQIYRFAGRNEGTHATMSIHDTRTISVLVAKGDIGLAEAYRDGWWDTPDLAALLTLGLENDKTLQPYLYGGSWVQLAARVHYYFMRNTMRGSRKNIHAHYDLGNAFYQEWLDETMSYSAAIFKDKNEPLKLAQWNKYDRILERLQHRSGSLLEIGCGWGGFAERALSKGDYGIKGITLSTEQYDFSKQRLQNRANIVLEDYRVQKGHYESIVSIEMFEAVGEKFWPIYFEKVKSLLSPKGNAVVQTITIGDSYFEHYRKSGDMIRSFIFPGGMLPSPMRFVQEANKAGLMVKDSFAFGADYAHTLTHWLQAFDTKNARIKSLGYDEPFARMWRFYLCACIASFTVGRTDVMQWELAHA